MLHVMFEDKIQYSLNYGYRSVYNYIVKIINTVSDPASEDLLSLP